MGMLSQDLRYALRLLRRAPGFSALAIATLALGIGATTAVYSIARPVLFAPLPFPHPEQVVEIAQTYQGQFNNGLNGDQALFYLAHQRTLGAAAIVDSLASGNLTGAGEARHVAQVRVSSGFFRVWGVAPAMGRDFSPADDEAGGPATAILSAGLWKSQFGGSAGVLGRTFELNEATYTVIGVMPASFTSLENNPFTDQPPDLWSDIQPTSASLAPLGPNLDVIGRLRPGTTLAQLNADLTASHAAYQQAHPGGNNRQGWGAELYQIQLARGNGPSLLLLLGAVALLLLIACANIANLLLARSSVRSRELAIRAALGADQGRIVRQLLTESAVLALLGAVGGWLLAWWTLPLLGRLAAAQMGLPLAPHLNGAVLLFTAVVALGTGILFGLAPAVHSSRAGLQAELKDSAATAATAGAGRARSALIVAEVAIAFLLLAGAGLLAASLVKLNQVNPGFSYRNILTVQTTLNHSRQASAAAAARYSDQVVAALERMPGVESAASITGVPLTRAMNYTGIVPGHTRDPRRYGIEWRAISPEFFRTLSIPIVAGRAFTAADASGAAPAAIISEVMARHYWPHGGAIGQAVEIPTGDNDSQLTLKTIVGVAADIRENGLDRRPPFTVYVPQAQASDFVNALENHWFPLGFVIHGAGTSLPANVRAAFRQVDADQPIFNVMPLVALKANSLGTYQFMGTLLGLFAGLALALGAVGIYGVLSYAVAQRRREIGVRMALGASAGRLLWQFLAGALKLAVIGLALGALGAIWLMRLLSDFLFGVEPADPAVLALVAAVLLVVAAAAALVPAWRASRTDPLRALQE
ncbi:MAG: ADOP family duplicated permease [Terriglobales bacterium]